jgi:hypothetical protein
MAKVKKSNVKVEVEESTLPRVDGIQAVDILEENNTEITYVLSDGSTAKVQK